METEGNRIKIFIIIVSLFLIPACSSAPESNKHQSAIISEQSQASVAPIKKFAGDFPTTNPPPKQYTNALGMDFVYIPAGTFMMGSPSYEYKRRSDEPQHEVTLSTGYYIQATEVTQGQWQKVMGENPSEFDNCGDKCPVEDVTWYETQDFIGKLQFCPVRKKTAVTACHHVAFSIYQEAAQTVLPRHTSETG